MKDSEDQGLQEPKKILFELDELYIDEGAQITKVHEFEPEKFIAVTWWINKLYIFKRSPNFLMNGGGVDTECTQVIEPSFGMNFQCIGMFKIPKTKTLFILKTRDAMILLDADTQQMHQLNAKKSNGTMMGDLLRVVPASQNINPDNNALNMDYS